MKKYTLVCLVLLLGACNGGEMQGMEQKTGSMSGLSRSTRLIRLKMLKIFWAMPVCGNVSKLMSKRSSYVVKTPP